MSNVKKAPRHEVISLRMTTERLGLLERYRRMLGDQHRRAVTIAEAAFLVLEERAVGLDRVATRHELLQTPTDSLDRIRKHWASHQTLSAPEWDVLAEYVQIATDADHQDPPPVRPVVPSRESYLALLEAFDAVYQHRNERASPHVWDYFGNLDGYATDDDGRRRISVPRAITAGDLTVSFAPSADTEFTTQIDFGSPRRFRYRIRRYPELMEWRAMLEAVSDPSWNGRYCVTAVSDDQLPHTRTLWLTQREVRVDFSEREWTALRDLVRQVCEHPDLQGWLQELQQQ